ncbi:rhomboid family intramembrane serine protease [Rhodobacteraceae bacterium]|nr:rhomboid family intramembrane serine protease [Paracoccaceae bacterium]
MMASPRGRGTISSGQLAIIVLVAICVIIEVLLQLGDAGLIGPPRFRNLVYEYGGFWTGLLKNWGPNYPAQPWLMFVTYGFLHAGLLHLGLNMLTLVSLALPVADRVGGRSLVLIYCASILGGGLGFALLSDSFRPMVGASGALFGLAGALLAWEYVDRFTLQKRLWPVARAILLLALLNVALYYVMDGLAWEAHLGGFIMGWIMALLVDPRGRANPTDAPETETK